MHDWMRSLAILGGTITTVTAVTVLLVGAVVSSPSLDPAASAAPIFDLAVAPDQIGGSLTVSGDRSGTLTLDGASGGSSFQGEGHAVTGFQQEYRLAGDDGQITFSRNPDEGVTQLFYDGLSFYLDPGDCGITLGERNHAEGLVAVMIDCPGISDIRGGGVVSIKGIVALPREVVGDRGGLPPSGGRVAVGSTTLEFSDAIVLDDGGGHGGGGRGAASGRVPLSVQGTDLASILGIEYDPARSEVFLIGMYATSGESASLPEPCPISVEQLGDLDPTTSVVRFTIDCDDAILPDGSAVDIEGTIVADSDVELGAGDE